MARESAFRPKTQEIERAPRTEASKRVEGPLQSLEKDKAQISGFNFALQAVLDGRITTEEQLRALANPRFRGGELVDERNNYVSIAKPGGNLITLNPR